MGMKGSARNLLLNAFMGSDCFVRGSRKERTLYLTFDDGPREEHTPGLLDLLARYGARATFFVTGYHVERRPEIVERILRAGHEIGNHSYRHTRFGSMRLADQRAEIAEMDELLQRHDERARHWFRPPQGHLSPSLAWALRRSRRRVALWSYDSLDYRARALSELVKRFDERPVANGEVILFHDDNPHTLGALEILLERWREERYAFRTLSGPRP